MASSLSLRMTRRGLEESPQFLALSEDERKVARSKKTKQELLDYLLGERKEVGRSSPGRRSPRGKGSSGNKLAVREAQIRTIQREGLREAIETALRRGQPVNSVLEEYTNLKTADAEAVVLPKGAKVRSHEQYIWFRGGKDDIVIWGDPEGNVYKEKELPPHAAKSNFPRDFPKGQVVSYITVVHVFP